MGIQFIENVLYDDDDDYQCSTCFSFNTNSSASSAEKEETLNSSFKKHQENQHYQEQHQPKQQKQQKQQQPQDFLFSPQTRNILSSKDLVGNSKEFRMENNKHHLRIIGNGNRIRIAHNSGNIQIIGNNTRLKIMKNSGDLKYTGNEGRICLGSESTQQMVDYIGCNGLLKVINSTEFNKSPKCNENNKRSRKTTAISPSISDKVNNNNNNNNNKRTNLPGNAITGISPDLATSTKSLLKPRVKSASCDELIDMQQENWQHFNNLLQHDDWQHFTKVSLPNLKDNINCKCKKNRNKSFFDSVNQNKNNNNNNNNNSNCNNSNNNNPMDNRKGINLTTHSNINNNFGDIIIKNSVNISIA